MFIVDECKYSNWEVVDCCKIGTKFNMALLTELKDNLLILPGY